ncbi:hypothetical protein WN48_01098 [Eufriesea mexicana]|nr:hypothetical protein WN48_01098 [Eufriesea mexicana]
MHRNRGRANRGDIIEKEWLLVCTYRISWHGHLYICRRATRGRSAVGDMFAGHDLLPTSATVNLGVTTSASATETQGGNRTPRHVEIFSNILHAISSFFPGWTGPQPRNAPCVTHMLQVPFCPSSLSSLPFTLLLAVHSFLTELMFVRSARKTLLWEQQDAVLSTSIPVDKRLLNDYENQAGEELTYLKKGSNLEINKNGLSYEEDKLIGTN